MAVGGLHGEEEEKAKRAQQRVTRNEERGGRENACKCKRWELWKHKMSIVYDSDTKESGRIKREDLRGVEGEKEVVRIRKEKKMGKGANKAVTQALALGKSENDGHFRDGFIFFVRLDGKEEKRWRSIDERDGGRV